jgi:triosephosphate isomerase
MKKIIIGNWKMQLNLRDAGRLAHRLSSSALGKKAGKNEVVVCPDYLALPSTAKVLRGGKIKLGAQDCAGAQRGAMTGEVSPADLKDLGVKYVIIGHSERREHLHENSAVINAKIKAALAKKLIPVLCVGEKLAERRSGQTRPYLNGELSRALHGVKIVSAADLIIAYEPVWAISGARGARPLDSAEAGVIQQFIKAKAALLLKKTPRVIYGGSVNVVNASAFLSEKNIDGLLVGSASLRAQEFIEICSQ